MGKKYPSRPERWNAACAKIREAYDQMADLKQQIEDGFGELQSLKEEYESWRDNTPDNLQQTATYEKLDEVCNLDLEPDFGDLDAVESALSDAEGIDLPRGHGRD